MLTREEIHSLRTFMKRVQPMQNQPIAKLLLEVQAWTQCMQALDREEKQLAAAPNDTRD